MLHCLSVEGDGLEGQGEGGGLAGVVGDGDAGLPPDPVLLDELDGVEVDVVPSGGLLGLQAAAVAGHAVDGSDAPSVRPLRENEAALSELLLAGEGEGLPGGGGGDGLPASLAVVGVGSEEEPRDRSSEVDVDAVLLGLHDLDLDLGEEPVDGGSRHDGAAGRDSEDCTVHDGGDALVRRRPDDVLVGGVVGLELDGGLRLAPDANGQGGLGCGYAGGREEGLGRISVGPQEVLLEVVVHLLGVVAVEKPPVLVEGVLDGLNIEGDGLADDRERGGVAVVGADVDLHVAPPVIGLDELYRIVEYPVLIFAAHCLVREQVCSVAVDPIDGLDASAGGELDASRPELLLAGERQGLLDGVGRDGLPARPAVVDEVVLALDIVVVDDPAGHLAAEVDVDAVLLGLGDRYADGIHVGAVVGEVRDARGSIADCRYDAVRIDCRDGLVIREPYYSLVESVLGSVQDDRRVCVSESHGGGLFFELSPSQGDVRLAERAPSGPAVGALELVVDSPVAAISEGVLHRLVVEGDGLEGQREGGGLAGVVVYGDAALLPDPVLLDELDGVEVDVVPSGGLLGLQAAAAPGHAVDGVDTAPVVECDAALAELLLAGGDQGVFSVGSLNGLPAGFAIVFLYTEEVGGYCASEVDVYAVLFLRLVCRGVVRNSEHSDRRDHHYHCGHSRDNSCLAVTHYSDSSFEG